MTTETESAAEAQTQETQHEQKTQEQQQQQPEKEKSGLQDALMAERRKRQEAEAYTRFLQQQQQAYQKQYKAKEPEEDEDEYTREIKQYTQSEIQRGIKTALEREYLAANPELAQINETTGRTWLEDNLEPILRKKPWLADVIKTAENRYARAIEIIDDYTPKSQPEQERQRLSENEQKPGNPQGIARSGQVAEMQNIKNMTRKEFSEYRAKMRGRRPNIR